MPARQSAEATGLHTGVAQQPEHQEEFAVDELIERFGGLRPMAERLGVPVSTVQGWKKRGTIPAGRHADVQAAVERLDGVPAPATAVFPATDNVPVAVADTAPPLAAETVAERVAERVAETPAAEEAPATETATDVAPEMTPEVETAADQPVAVVATANPAVATGATANPEDTRVTENDAKTESTSVEAGPAGDAAAPALNVDEVMEFRPSAPGTAAAVAAAFLAVIGAAVSVTAPMWAPNLLEEQGRLEQRLMAAEAALKSLDVRVAKAPAVAGALVVRDLRTELATGAPFASELKAVRASGIVTPADEELLKAIAAYADKGVPTRAEISQRFDWLASDLYGSGWLGLGRFMPAMPQISMPAMSMPEMPKMAMPEMPKMSMPEMPKVSMPEMPKVSMPQMPDVSQMSATAAGIPGQVWEWVSGTVGAMNWHNIAVALRLREETDVAKPAAPAPVAAAKPAAAAPAPAPAPVKAPAAAPVAAPPVAVAAPPVAAVPPPAPAPVKAAAPTPAKADDSVGELRATVTEAGKLLKSDNLAGAVAAMETLKGDAAETAKTWIADAKARITADKASQALADDVAKALQ